MNFLILAAVVVFATSAPAESQAHGAKEQAAPTIGETEFVHLLSEVKALRKKGERTYTISEIKALPSHLGPISPKLIVVRRNSVEFLISSDLDKPEILTFTRLVGVWSPRAVLWVVDLKSADTIAATRLWSVKEWLSEEESAIETMLRSIEAKQERSPDT